MTTLNKAQRRFGSATLVLVTASTALAVMPAWLAAQALDPIVYTVRVPAPDTHFVEVEAAVPTGGRASIELMMPIWSPGYYRVENYADHVDNVAARAPDGRTSSEKTQKNRWRIATDRLAAVVVTYRV
jgi:hypothetical protein